VSRVYVVAAGERDEGHSPVAVFATLAAAKANVVEAGGIPPLMKRGPGQWWTPKPNGVDEFWIYSMPVLGGEQP
jgi:hypothetical protein